MAFYEMVNASVVLSTCMSQNKDDIEQVACRAGEEQGSFIPGDLLHFNSVVFSGCKEQPPCLAFCILLFGGAYVVLLYVHQLPLREDLKYGIYICDRNQARHLFCCCEKYNTVYLLAIKLPPFTATTLSSGNLIFTLQTGTYINHVKSSEMIRQN